MNLLLTKLWAVKSFPERQWAQTADRRMTSSAEPRFTFLIGTTEERFGATTNGGWTAMQK